MAQQPHWLVSSAAAIALLLTFSAGDAKAQSTRTIMFTNVDTSSATDLHLSFGQATTVTSGPPNSRSAGNRVEFYGLTAPLNSTVTVSVKSSSEILKLSNWYWTTGGTATEFGTIPGPTHTGDNSSPSLSVLDTPASGDGIIEFALGSNAYHFSTTAGFTAAQTITSLASFASGLFDEIPLVTPYVSGGNSITFYGNIMGDSSRELRLSILKKDATQAIALVPEPSIWISLLLGFAATGAALRGGRRRTATEVRLLWRA